MIYIIIYLIAAVLFPILTNYIYCKFIKYCHVTKLRKVIFMIFSTLTVIIHCTIPSCVEFSLLIRSNNPVEINALYGVLVFLTAVLLFVLSILTIGVLDDRYTFLQFVFLIAIIIISIIITSYASYMCYIQYNKNVKIEYSNNKKLIERRDKIFMWNNIIVSDEKKKIKTVEVNDDNVSENNMVLPYWYYSDEQKKWLGDYININENSVSAVPLKDEEKSYVEIYEIDVVQINHEEDIGKTKKEKVVKTYKEYMFHLPQYLFGS